jgi:hypothetical protein
MPHRRSFLAAVVALLALFMAVAAAARSTGPSFSGNGSRSLPPFRVSTPSTMFWRNTGDIFQTFPKGASSNGGVNSQAHSGTTYMPSGTYRLTVNAIGSWTIRVTTGTERPQAMGGGRVGFRGNGSRDLPPFKTRHGSQLVWTNTGSIFQIFPKEFSGGGDVNSQAHRGTSYMDAGTHTLTVNAIGTWTVRWKP